VGTAHIYKQELRHQYQMDGYSASKKVYIFWVHWSCITWSPTYI